MKKLTKFALISIAITFLATMGMADANPIYFYYLPTQPITTSPILNIQSPTEGSIQTSNITMLNFTVTKPTSWFNNQSEDEYQPINGYSSNMPVVYFSNGRINSWNYEIDGVRSQNFSVEDIHGDELAPTQTFSFLNNLSLTEGLHNLTVIVHGKTYYRDLGSKIGDGVEAHTHSKEIILHSDAINFTVDHILPTIGFNQSYQNMTFRTSNVTLSLVSNKPVSQLIYSLDSQSNMTADDNQNLSISNLSNGNHTLIVYAKDTYGVVSNSSIVSFNVKVQEPFPWGILVAVLIVSSIAVLSVWLLIYHKRVK
jgi:hypothetical protein